MDATFPAGVIGLVLFVVFVGGFAYWGITSTEKDSKRMDDKWDRKEKELDKRNMARFRLAVLSDSKKLNLSEQETRWVMEPVSDGDLPDEDEPWDDWLKKQGMLDE